MPDYRDFTDSAVAAESLRNRDAFGVLITRYQDKLGRYLLRLGVNEPEDRNDLLQDVFISVYRNLNDYDPSLSFSSWIYRITHNAAMSFHRKRTGHPFGFAVDDGDAMLLELRDDRMDTETVAEERITKTHLARALSRLEAKYRDILILRFYEEKEYQEISDILRIPLGTVSTMIFRAKKRLKHELSHLTDQ